MDKGVKTTTSATLNSSRVQGSLLYLFLMNPTMLPSVLYRDINKVCWRESLKHIEIISEATHRVHYPLSGLVCSCFLRKDERRRKPIQIVIHIVTSTSKTLLEKLQTAIVCPQSVPHTQILYLNFSHDSLMDPWFVFIFFCRRWWWKDRIKDVFLVIQWVRCTAYNFAHLILQNNRNSANIREWTCTIKNHFQAGTDEKIEPQNMTFLLLLGHMWW